MTDQKQPIDWAEIERDYRTGTMGLREMARWYKVSDGAIRKKAKHGGWVRENAPAGTQRAPAHQAREVEVVRTPLTPENVSPEAIVGRGRNLVLRLLDELDATTCRVGELEALIGGAYDGDQDKAREAALAAISLKNRSEVLKSLATAAKTFAESGAAQGKKAERQAKGEQIAKGGGKFAAPPPPRLVADNTR